MNTYNLLNINSYHSPFGSLQPNRYFGSENYRYGFNGKEKDAEIKGEGNSYDFGARIYDPRIGRWLSRDPWAQKYTGLTPYNFVGNMPIIAIDPDGKRIYFVPGLGYDETKGAASNSKYVTGIPSALESYLSNHDTYSKTVQGSKGGRLNDMLYVAWRGQKPRLNVANDKRAIMIASTIAADVIANPIDREKGEQMNILAASQGTVSTANAVIGLLDDPTKFGLDENFTIDNLVLAGSPISPKSKIYAKLEELKAAGKIKSIEYEDYQADGDKVTGLAGESRIGAIFRGFGYIGTILKEVGRYKQGKEFQDPHVRASENLPVGGGDAKTFGDELKGKLENDDIH